MINITEIIVNVVGLLTSLAIIFLIPWLRTKFTQTQLEKADTLIHIAVGAAEQLFTATEGNAKKDYVLSYLEKSGIKVDLDTVNAMIENAVLELHNELYGKKPVAHVETLCEPAPEEVCCSCETPAPKAKTKTKAKTKKSKIAE